MTALVSPASFTGGGGGGSAGVGDVTVDIYNPIGARASDLALTVNTEAVTATPAFGTAPYAYAWTQSPATDADFTPTAPASAVTAFKRTGVASGDIYTADFIVTVTDALGAVGTSDTVSATVSNYGDLGGFA